MKSKEEFLKIYRISEKKFMAAQISWEMLCKIYDDYESKMDKYLQIGKQFYDEFFVDPREFGLHSVYWRVKNPEHLIAKIIRKRTENYKKYRDIDEKNYWKIVGDLVGFRGLMIFKEDWPPVHKFILKYFKDNPKLYWDWIDDTQHEKETDYYLTEAPKAHIREGDHKKLYLEYLGSENIISKQNYRSVHYNMKYHGVYIELQLRTLFEEALGEIDHKIRYPNHVTEEKLNRYSGIMNHLVGVADELGSFYLELSKKDTYALDERLSCEVGKEDIIAIRQEREHDKNMSTVAGCLNNIINY